MTLIDRAGYRTEGFTRVAAADVSTVEHPLVSYADLDAALIAANGQIGVELPNTAKAQDIAPQFARLSLIAVSFPSFADGRGFSLARRLRRSGYTGRLRAVGPLIADQLAYALACGFDEIELPDASAARQPESQWQKAAVTISATYQRGYDNGGNILNQRRAARKAASHD